MTTALIVDDSSVDRELVSSLLQASTSLVLNFADDGADALRQLATAEPDIIVTDLHMPEVDGLRLVETVREEHAHVPIVLITGQGSENLAVKALRSGAASYVPKKSLSDDLVLTVMHVLSLARADQSTQAVQRCWMDTKCSFRIPNDYNLIPALVKQLRDIVESMQLLDNAGHLQLALALEEAISNALYHGNLELTSDQLESVGYDLENPDGENIVDTRIAQPPYSDRHVHVEADITRERAKFTIRDEGPGFDFAAAPSPEAVLAAGTICGRGLAQMQLFSDDISFNARGNEVILVKHATRN